LILNSKIILRIGIIILIFLLGFENISLSQTLIQYGKATFYSKEFSGKRTSSGEIYNNSLLTAAHRTLPFNTVVRVTNIDNNKSVEVRVNDRGPISKHRIIDLSRRAAEEIDIIKQGIGNVKVEVIQLYKPVTDSDSIRILAKMANPPIDTNVYTDSSGLDKSGWYDVTVKDIIPYGYGIQVGTFSHYTNMIKEIDSLQKIFSYPILVQNTKLDDKLIYRVILGPFDNKAKAQQALLEIRKKKVKGFIMLLKP
jgi:rare lipoprotein A